MRTIRYHVEVFLTAIQYFTRLPVPRNLPWSQERLDEAARWFPLVGAVVGALGSAVLLGTAEFLPLSVAVVVSMAATIRATGAFHEDGLADSCDGLGGGVERPRVLEIMKDSRIGSYGAVGLVLALLCKAALLFELAWAGRELAAIALVAVHALSRLASTGVMAALPYVRDDGTGRVKPLAHVTRFAPLCVATVCGLAPLVLVARSAGVVAAMAALVGAALAALWLGRMAHRRLGGVTGDVLGAVQQVAELAAYAGILVALGAQ
jgi:adenosylcobinamide-GDP ribazoletransferase